MPIKRPAQADAQNENGNSLRIKRVQKSENGGDFVTKESLEGHLLVVTVKEFNSKHVGSYGLTNKVVVDIIDLDHGNSVHEGTWFFSNLAAQIGRDLAVDESGVGRIISGPTKNGNGTWWGFEFSDTDEDVERGNAALDSATVPF